MRKIIPQTLVEYEGKIGVTVPDLPGMMNCNSEDETGVVFDGVNYSQGITTEQLKIIGKENAIPDPKKCGAGRGEECCIFLTCGANGFECDRFSSLRTALIFKDMSAKRHPANLFPNCQLSESKGWEGA